MTLTARASPWWILPSAPATSSAARRMTQAHGVPSNRPERQQARFARLWGCAPARAGTCRTGRASGDFSAATAQRSRYALSCRRSARSVRPSAPATTAAAVCAAQSRFHGYETTGLIDTEFMAPLVVCCTPREVSIISQRKYQAADRHDTEVRGDPTSRGWPALMPTSPPAHHAAHSRSGSITRFRRAGASIQFTNTSISDARAGHHRETVAGFESSAELNHNPRRR
jgi:hypothetical protein